MDNASFETQVWVSDEEDKLSFYVGGNDSQQNSAQCDKVDLEECGKAPKFGKRRRSTQEVENKNSEEDLDGKSLEEDKSFSEEGGSPLRECVLRSSQDTEIPDFDSKDKMHWFVQFKRQRGVNKKLMRSLKIKNKRIQEISKQVTALADILNN